MLLTTSGDRVGGVTLIRHQYVSAVRDALSHGGFVEIRGDVGVGKSGVLKHFARQINIEGTSVVLSPIRTTPNGWVAMRAVIGFDGTARDLLSDLASGGAAVLFVDNLDSFPESEQKTVIDSHLCSGRCSWYGRCRDCKDTFWDRSTKLVAFRSALAPRLRPPCHRPGTH